MAPPWPDAADALARLVDARRSCRGFVGEPLERGTIERILAIAQRAASWCNAQPWHVTVVGGAALERLRDELPRHAATHPPAPDFAWPRSYDGVYRERRRDCGVALYSAVGVARGDAAGAERQARENFRFFGAPHVAIVTADDALGVYGAIDCGGWLAQFMLAARACGVASIAQAALAAYPDFWRERLGLGPDRRVVCGVSFGREDPGHPANAVRTSRAALDEAVRWVDDLAHAAAGRR